MYKQVWQLLERNTEAIVIELQGDSVMTPPPAARAAIDPRHGVTISHWCH
jgi:hypothetical protein